MADLIYREESYNIMGACFEVYFKSYPKIEYERIVL
jgi:hypothetical protein